MFTANSLACFDVPKRIQRRIRGNILFAFENEEDFCNFGRHAKSRFPTAFWCFVEITHSTILVHSGGFLMVYVSEGPVKCNQRGIQCDYCDKWYHTRCCAMSDHILDSLANSSCIWICTNCGLPSFSSSLFDSFSGDKTSNSFDPLAQLNHEILNANSTPSDNGNPVQTPRCSTPDHQKSNIRKKPPTTNKVKVA